MNTIYRSIWNAVTGSWTAVSEAQKSKGKKSKAVVASVALTAMTLAAMPTLAAIKEDPYHFVPGDAPLVTFGDNKTAGFVKYNPLDPKYSPLMIVFKLSNDYKDENNYKSFTDDDGSDLLSHSYGLVQKLLTIEQYTNYGTEKTESTWFEGSNSNAIAQNVVQDRNLVATSYYAVGTGAYNILSNYDNRELLGIERLDGGDLRLKEKYWGSDWQFSKTGMHIEGGWISGDYRRIGFHPRHLDGLIN